MFAFFNFPWICHPSTVLVDLRNGTLRIIPGTPGNARSNGPCSSETSALPRSWRSWNSQQNIWWWHLYSDLFEKKVVSWSFHGSFPYTFLITLNVILIWYLILIEITSSSLVVIEFTGRILHCCKSAVSSLSDVYPARLRLRLRLRLPLCLLRLSGKCRMCRKCLCQIGRESKVPRYSTSWRVENLPTIELYENYCNSGIIIYC